MSNINKRFGVQLLDDFREFGAKGSAALTKAGKEGWKAAVSRQSEKPHVVTGAMRYNWKLKTSKDSYVPKRIERKYPTVPGFKFRVTLDKGFSIYNNMPYAYAVEHGLGTGDRVPLLALPEVTSTIQEVAYNEFRKIIVGR